MTRELDELAANLFPHLQRSGGVQPFAGLSDGAVHTWEGISRQNGAAARVRVFVRVINDYAVSVTAMGDRAALERREPLIRGVATSLTFAAPGGPGSGAETTPRVAQGGQPSSPSLSDGSPVAQQWLERLRGKRLTSLSSYSSGGAGGYSSRTVVMLWPDGRFDGQSSSSVSVDVPGASGSSGGSGSTSGRWRIYATRDGLGVLELTYANGRQEQNALQDRNGQTFINGSRWFVTNPQ